MAVSPCGTFAVVGSAGGAIDMFNLQSGLHRQSFPSRLPVSRASKSRNMAAAASSHAQNTRHSKAVTGLMIDNLNRTVISCGLDGKVKVRDSYSPHVDDIVTDLSCSSAVLGLAFGVVGR